MLYLAPMHASFLGADSCGQSDGVSGLRLQAPNNFLGLHFHDTQYVCFGLFCSPLLRAFTLTPRCHAARCRTRHAARCSALIGACSAVVTKLSLFLI